MALVEVTPSLTDRTILIRISKELETFSKSLVGFLQRTSNKIKYHPESPETSRHDYKKGFVEIERESVTYHDSFDKSADHILLLIKVPASKDFDTQLVIILRMIVNFTQQMTLEIPKVEALVKSNSFISVARPSNPLEVEIQGSTEFLDDADASEG